MSPYFFPGVSPVLFPTSVLRTVVSTIPGGDEGNRTLDPLLARQVLSHLSYIPISGESLHDPRKSNSSRLLLQILSNFAVAFNFNMSLTLICL